jgi:hypothetical protein
MSKPVIQVTDSTSLPLSFNLPIYPALKSESQMEEVADAGNDFFC